MELSLGNRMSIVQSGCVRSKRFYMLPSKTKNNVKSLYLFEISISFIHQIYLEDDEVAVVLFSAQNSF